MRIVNFKRDVLWPISYRLGLNPRFDLLSDQANSIATYINAWVRRVWDSQDWPEWTYIDVFQVNQTSHYVGWDQLPVATNGHSLISIGKVLKVYLLDPRTTYAPVDTPFRLSNVGIHCGFEHGQTVWIKYVSRAPQYTADVWNTSVTYDKDELVYSPVSGECYKSKANNNLGHDPSQVGGSDGPLLPIGSEETAGVADNPGAPAANEITDIFAAAISVTPIVDPPANGSVFFIEVYDDAGASAGTATHTANGSDSLVTIFTDLESQLVSALSGFTSVTLVTGPPLKIRIEDNQDFSIHSATYTIATNPTALPLKTVQAQAFAAAVSPTVGSGQQFVVSITDQQVSPGAIYGLTFTTVDSEEHIATYTALDTDNAQQILQGLVNSVIALQGADPFFLSVQTGLDVASPSATFVIGKTMGLVSLNTTLETTGSTYWTYIPFPFALVDQVVRGSVADTYGEQGQLDKKAPEEQAVQVEQQLRAAAFTAPKHDPLTDQYQGGKSRFDMP